MTRQELLIAIIDEIDSDPLFFSEVISCASGALNNVTIKARADCAQWETIALSAVDARLFKSNKKSMAAKIDELRASARFDWSEFIQEMKGYKP